MASRFVPDAVALPQAPDAPRAHHLVDVLRERAGRPGQAPAYTFLEEGEAEGGSLSWEALDRSARAIAARLSEVARPGDRALLLFPAGLDFVAAFFGCLYAGVVAVPSYPPRPNRGQQRLRAIARDASPAVVLASRALLPRAAGLIEEVPELAAARWIASDDPSLLEGGAAEAWRDPGIRAEDLAFLQYTSGSTSLPKGVMVSHANLVANERMIAAAFRQTEESVVVGWLPLYHDMGLIGNVLQPLWSGGRCILMSPVAFLQKPLRWLAAISRYGATTSGGPNFAYDLCARKISPEERAGLDLSRWRVAYNGAEPVRRATLDRFAAAFAESGFSPDAFYPCYGLAEATLFASGGVPETGAQSTRFEAEELRHGRAVAVELKSPEAPAASELVSCGGAWLEQRLAIVDPESREELPEGRVGEIWITGPNVGGGYWGRPEATAETFAATTASGAGPYLRTGDLGFRHGSDLFVAGRQKDLIILRGRNLYPQDLEATAEAAHPALRAGNGAAFSVGAEAGSDGDGSERLVLVYEVDRRAGPEVHGAVAAAVRAAIAEEHEAQVSDLVLVKIGGVPKTSSGKVQRHACRAGYLAGTLPVVARSAATDEVAEVAELDEPGSTDLSRDEIASLPPAARSRALERQLATWAARALGVSAARIERDAPLSGYGLDSLAALELRSAVEERLGVALPLATLFEGATLGDLATLVAADLETVGAALPKPVETVPVEATGEAPGETFPLSYGQEGLWVTERLAPASGAYNLAAAFRVAKTDEGWIGRLEAALRRIVAHHPALRLRLVVENGEPRQRLAAEDEPGDVDFTVEDLGGRSLDEALLDLSAAAYRPFDLALGPLLRVRAISGRAEDLLLFAVHHSVVDFAALGTIARDLGTLWRGGALAPAVPEGGYPAWIRHQRVRLAGPAGERLRAFWRERLGSGVPDLDLPADRTRPPGQSFEGQFAATEIAPESVARLRSLARKRGTTLQAALLSGFAAELALSAGQDGFALGVPTAGRPGSRFAETVGYFVNPVAVRARTEGDPAFRDLLERTRDELLGALEHADDPFPLLAAELAPARDAARSPLFQAMLVHHAGRHAEDAALAEVALGQGGARFDLGGLSLVSLPLPGRRAQFDLTLRSAAGRSGALHMVLEANADLFDAATATRLLDRVARLLAAAAAEPESNLSRLTRLAPAEAHQLLAEWNDRGDVAGAVDAVDADTCLHDLFAAQAARTPEAEALRTGSERLTYRELAGRVSRLAARLAARGAGPEIRVAVCLNRSADLVTALLAVLEVGSAYVPLDPTYPRERLAIMLGDSGAKLLITEGACLPALPEVLPETLRLDDGVGAAAAAEPSDDAPKARSVPGNLAYLIYTSGSTGVPKAVAIEHRSVVAFARWARREMSDAELSGVAAVTSVCFDLSVFELFVPLCWGGRTILAENALALPSHPARDEISLVNTVPSAMAELARLDVPFPSLRAVILAGEPLPGELVERIYRMTERASGPRRARPELTVRNLYGPSEDTTYSTGAVIPRGEPRPSIGRPIDGTRAYLLDRSGRPAPLGVPGELLLGGAGLARGYLGRPETTAERFVPDPFAAGETGARLYRTGDLARHRADGELDFLGRIDNQVKIRGFRIELGEIEAALLAHPEIAECVVVAKDGRLIAYVAGGGAEGGDLPARLPGFLAATLPAYMIPFAFVVLPALPRSANGKVDRKALPDVRHAAEGPEREPADEVELRLAELFAEVLEIESIGLDDDFFVRGGHSLAAMRLLSRVGRGFGIELPARALFEAPTVARLAERVRGELAAGAEADDLPIARIADEERGRPQPASFAQSRIWFLERLDPGRATYHLPGRLALSGALDVAALGASLRRAVARHDALRTGFEERREGPVQIVAPAVSTPIELPILDLSALASAMRRSEADRASGLAARRAFDLARPPLARALLLALEAERHELILVLHHLVSDGWSLGLLAEEIGAGYGGRALPPLPVQVVDAAAWERRLLSEGYLAREQTVWAARLAEPPAALDLPVRPGGAGWRGARLESLLAADAGTLDASARRLGATPFMALSAAWGAVLGRFGASEDVLLGTPVSVRTRPELEPLIGCFVNTVTLRVDLAGDPSFGGQVERLRAVCLEAYAHRHLPYDRLVELLRPEGSGVGSAPFQAFVVLDEGLPRPCLPGLDAQLEPIFTGTAKFDLMLALERRGEGRLAASLEYACDRIDGATAARILGGFAELFEAATAEPGRRLGELPLLSEQERAQLVAWGTGPASAPREPLLLDDLVARWERETPEALAVADPAEEITYAELGARANRLARRLRSLGVVEDDRVAICLERSVDLIVAELAALRAGAAYAPIDPAYPEERRADMVALSAARVVITRSELFGAWCGAERGVEILRIDVPAETAGDAASASPPPVFRDPERLAYAVFTSGSSGRPKGVAMSHRGALHIVSWHLARYGWNPADRGAQIAAPSFDAAVIEIWPALASGASLHVPPAEVRLAASAQLDWLARERVTIAWVPTVIAEGIVALPPPPGLALRCLTTGGDRLHRGKAPGSPFSLSNEYGPAENAVISTQSVPVGDQPPAIGRPIDDVRVYVLDRRLDPVPAGASGELIVAGNGLARGYLADPAQTAERFVPDPFAGGAGARMYRTGDRVRFRPNGEIDFLGRLDAQVKIRGQRIELGEIEAALLAEPGVAEAAVGIREGAKGDRRLVAYLVFAGEAIDDRKLIEALGRRLSDAMVPRVFLRLAALPMTANGKVDARALAALPLPAAAQGIAPRNAAEARLAAIWADLLGVESVGVEDDFFALGGHSLLAAQLAYRLRDELSIEVPVATLFAAPTVAELARWLAERRLLSPEPAAEAIPRVSREAPLPLSVAQERIWFLEELEGPSALHHIAAGFAGEGRLDVSALRAALSGLWSRHEALRSRFAVMRGEPVQTFAPVGELPMPRIDLSALFEAPSGTARAEPEAERLSLEAARLPFALGLGPLLRARLVTLGPERFRLALVVHHLVADGVSVGILEGELAELYQAALERRPAVLPELPCQYADFAVWQRRRLAEDDATTRSEIEFWRAELDDLPPLALPADRAPGGAPRHLGRTLAFSLGGESQLGVSLADLARQAGTTPFVALLAGFAAALSRFSGQERFGLGVPEAGRPRGEAERLVGLFVNTLVVPVDLEDDPCGGAFAVRLRARLAAALAHSTTPFERLVEALAPERDRERTPFFQVMVSARPEAARRLALPGVALIPEALETGTAKFDLTLLADAAAGPSGSASIEYDAGRFDAATIERWIARFGRLSADLAARPEARLSELALLSPAERSQLIAAATGPEERPVGGPEATLLDDLVARWEAETPEALAVADSSGRATYAELGARANALSWRLRHLGVGQDAIVAVCLDRSVELIAAELGALRAGAAYAPIDPAYPEERRASMVAVSDAAAVVTLSSLAGDWTSGRPVVLLDLPEEGSASPRAGAPPVLRDPERLAYAIFTSGTTGRPKCVAMSHRGALHIVSWHLDRFGWTAADRGTQVSGPSFDAAVIEIWPALAAGASLHVPGADARLSAPDLLGWLGRERVTIAWAPTPLVELIAAEEAPKDLALRFFQTGGDRLHRGAPEGAGYVLCNQYGPAENAVITTQGESVASPGAAGPVPSIGRPIAGVRAFVLDRRLRLAPPGTPGEVAVSGGGLARGYVSDPRQTAERFVPDPFAGKAGARMYRTGDRARLRADGSFEFLGRLDNQVKIRGQRIELGEIEAALRAVPGVREAAVAVQEQTVAGAADRRLVAFVVGAADLPDQDLVEPLKARLADAMVPRVFHRLGALPTTANGKIDRRALARLSAGAPELRRTGVRRSGERDAAEAPEGALEHRIATLFARALGRGEVGRHEDFFALGGHSLLASQVVLPLRADLGWNVPLAALFDRPTVADLAAWLAEAGPEAKLFFPSEPTAAIEPVPRAPEMPLSPAQERLWFIEQLEGPSPQYHIPGSFEIEGGLDRGALAAALDRLWSRHEALRARFAMSGSGPVQSFAPPGRLALPEADLGALPAASAAAAAESDRLLAAAVERPFDLGRGPLLRMLIVGLGPAKCRLALAVHHLVADGVSFAVLESELGELYAAAVGGRPARLAPLAVQYADFAVWRRDRFDAERIALRVAKRAEELESASEPLELPTDRPRPPVARHRGAYREIGDMLDAEAVRSAIASLAKACGATPYQVWLALFSALLGRLSGRQSFLLGLPVSGRVPGTEGMVGLFADTRVIRVDLDSEPTGTELIERSRERLLALEAGGEVPFDRLVEALPASRDRSFAPLYQASLVARVARGGLALPGVELRPMAVGTATAKRDLTLFVDAGEGGRDLGAVEFDIDLFDLPTIRRFVAQLGRLAVAVAGRPDERLSNLDLIAHAERHQLLVEINERSSPGVPPPPGVTYLDQLSEVWERETPDAVAVSDASGAITYGELKRRADRLAARLLALGVAEEERVAICLDRGIELVVAELAAMRAGGAYAPIDPAYPPGRRADMAAVASARIVVTRTDLLGPWSAGLTVIAIDSETPAESFALPSARRRGGSGPDRLAYSMFTSGSSGRPKGVGVSHRGALHIVAWSVRRYGYVRSDRVAQVSGPSFDAAVIEIWTAFAVGASVHVPSQTTRLSPVDLFAWYAREGVTLTWTPTPLGEALIAEPEPAGLALRYLQTGGDRLHRGASAGASYRLSNHYGPVENSVYMMEGEALDSVLATRGAGALPTIGRPVDGIAIYVLDRSLALAPRGAPGELVSGGRGVARGYLGDPAYTADRFRPDPFSETPGGRMYRTGDRVRVRQDGEVDFLGRIDTQVKIRGQRIELGEIEAALLALPAVREAAVLVREEPGRRADRKVVAYVVLAEEGIGDRELIEPLAFRLADAMVPRRFVRLDALPVNPSGKIDRRALAAIPLAAAQAAETGEAARESALEAEIAAVWAGFLDLDRVGRDDDFFALGGHSLLAARVIYRLREALGVELPVAALFEAPTVAGLARRVEAMRKAGARPTDAAPPIARADRSQPIPLSLAQERLWFIEQLEGPSALYHIPAAFAAEGELDFAALAAALSAIWSRHEALRARIADSDLGPVQSFAPPGRAPLFLVDLSALAPRGSEAESARARTVEGRRPFDLANGPLLRALVIRRSMRRHDLALVFHHLVADGVSLQHVERELSMLYAWALGGPLQAPPALPMLALGYADVAVWQRAHATEEWLAPRLAEQLAELAADDGAAIEPLELPADRPRANVSRHRGANLALAPWVDGEAVSRALTSLSARFGTTAFQTWFAAYGALLARLSGRELLAIGLPAAGRTAETEPLVGLFADTRVARAGLAGDPTAAELLAAARARLVATEARGEVPFERLVEALDPARLRSVAPLFQAALVSRPATGRGLRLPGLDLSPIDLAIETAKWDLTLYVDPEPGAGASGGAEYDADLFDAATVGRWLGQLGRLLADMATRPEARLSDLVLLSHAERLELLAATSGPASAPVPGEAAQLDDLVARWERETPEALAVADPNGRLTYGELGARANRLAWRLRALGVSEDDRVAICLDRSVDLIVAVLGAMRAGAAYAPIDPAYPEERRGDMVLLSEASVVVTRTELAGAWCGSAKVLALDAEPDLLSLAPIEAPPRRRDPEGLAYAIFTSGSTGRPKGVAMTHRGALHIVSWHLDRFGWRPSDRGSQVSGPSFDAAVIEIWPALASGASLHVPAADIRHEAASLLAWFAAERLTVGWVPTPIYDLLAVEPHPADLALRFLQTGGDRLLRGAPAGAPYILCNQYGPAENAVVTTQGESFSEGGRPGEVPPIGRPIAGVRVYIADRRLGLAAQGAAGEVVAAGGGLGRGYLSDPAQTAERFVPDPFGEEPGGRMYRTGDRARLRPDGRLEFLGRIDRQVKIRGQRIELGEIEAALLDLPGVREAAVVIHEKPGTERPGSARRLVAFVVAEPEAAGVADRELLAALRLRLAEAMVPRSFVHLDELPLTANGKVDRRALDRLAAVSSGAGDSGFSEPVGEPPRGEIENEIAAIWSDLLEIPAVGRGDNFFDLGGHSLLATRAAQRLRRTFGIEMPLSVLFDQPTLGALGRWITEAVEALEAPAPGGPMERSIPRADRSLPLPLSFAQERLWLLDRFEPESSTYTIPAAIRLSGPLAVPALRAAVGLLAERHESLRTTFALAGDRPVQRIAEHGSLALPLGDLSALPAGRREAERARLYERLAALPFDLERGPLARLWLVALGEAEHALLLALHHSISDGWSVGVLVHDLAELYGGGVSGLPAVLPALAIQVADHAVWQRGELAGESLAHRLAHWRTLLLGAPPALELPLDRPRPAVRTFSGAAASLVLDAELSDGVRRLAREGGATLFMTLLAAWAHQLGRLAGQDDVVIGTPAAERDRPEIEPLIGMFLNTLVLRLGLGVEAEAGSAGTPPSFRELIRRSRERVLDAFAHEVPFERLLDEVQPARDLSRTPLFQVFFNMVNLPKIRLAIEGLAIEPLAAPEASAKFDLTVYAAEEGQEIRLEWVYNSALFGAERIAAMLDQYRELLAQAVAEPDRPAAELSLVARSAVLPDPRLPLSDAWMGAVTERFNAWVEKAPERLAVEDPTESFTYGELAERAYRLARRLRRDGVAKGDVVAILGHRSARLVSTVLGVLEAGAAFTILDPAHPPSRLADTLRLARPRGFVALEAAGPVPAAVAECLDELQPTSRLLVPAAGSTAADPTADEPASPVGIELGPDDIAYLSFTSGSTGVPKGILGRHGPLSHFVPWQVRRFGFGPGDRYSMLSGLAHDPLQRDMFTPLQTGAAVVAPVPGDIAIPGRLAAWMRDRRVTVAHLTPAMGQILCEPAPGQPAPEVASLAWAFFVGDVLTRRDVARLQALAPNVRVVNYYGSTETQRSVGYHAVAERAGGESDLAKQSLPLGRGIEDVQLLVVNRSGRLAGVGEVGEILVRSSHLAAGYVGDPEGTAARFTSNPLGDPGSADRRNDRVYRTGDLGRYLPDGEVEFAGRGDVQVKIRGFRIEPGEVEAFLGRHPAVRECVVVARERPAGRDAADGEKRLVAYVVLDGAATTADLRAFLKSRLPEYMVPAVFAILEKLPVNPNGKVDRKALPEPAEEARGGAAPQTEIERQLAAILREVLGVEKVGRDDNFFELGGNSLQMVKVHARVQEAFGTDLQVVQLFTNPTVGALAAFLTQGEAAPRPAAVVEDRSEKLATGRDRLKRRLVQRKTEGEQ